MVDYYSLISSLTSMLEIFRQGQSSSHLLLVQNILATRGSNKLTDVSALRALAFPGAGVQLCYTSPLPNQPRPTPLFLDYSKNCTNLKVLFFPQIYQYICQLFIYLQALNYLLHIDTSACGFSFIMPHLAFWADCRTLLVTILNPWEGRCDAFLELSKKGKRMDDNIMIDSVS